MVLVVYIHTYKCKRTFILKEDKTMQSKETINVKYEIRRYF
jgi:hypothetical protein